MNLKIFIYLFFATNLVMLDFGYSEDKAADDSKASESSDNQKNIEPKLDVCVYKESGTSNLNTDAGIRYTSEFHEDDRLGFSMIVSGKLEAPMNDFTETWMQGHKLAHKSQKSLVSDRIYKSSKSLRTWREGDWSYSLTNTDGSLFFKADFRIQRFSKSYVVSFKNLPRDCARFLTEQVSSNNDGNSDEADLNTGKEDTTDNPTSDEKTKINSEGEMVSNDSIFDGWANFELYPVFYAQSDNFSYLSGGFSWMSASASLSQSVSLYGSLSVNALSYENEGDFVGYAVSAIFRHNLEVVAMEYSVGGEAWKENLYGKLGLGIMRNFPYVGMSEVGFRYEAIFTDGEVTSVFMIPFRFDFN